LNFINARRDFASFLLNFEIANIYTDADFWRSRPRDIGIVDKVAVYECTNDDKFTILNFINFRHDFASFLLNFEIGNIYTEADFWWSKPGDIGTVGKAAVYDAKLDDKFNISNFINVRRDFASFLPNLYMPPHTLRPTFRGKGLETSE
jgi:hypothetical protein